ncbi:hypothetical protein Ga0609869_002049 [Rhodovulum iodosum]|uniref:Uncharacterized protein n=1 Tax=Rhodovulum iodosum TaxID=68291 RepID=A0ABV3XTN5_9RHOB|nr:hypothetical protein EJA01_13010 [Rhodovulum robiginosum]
MARSLFKILKIIPFYKSHKSWRRDPHVELNDVDPQLSRWASQGAWMADIDPARGLRQLPMDQCAAVGRAPAKSSPRWRFPGPAFDRASGIQKTAFICNANPASGVDRVTTPLGALGVEGRSWPTATA